MRVISVSCPPDPHLHLAKTRPGIGTEVLTLCLLKWKDSEDCREDSVLCTECVEKWKERST